MLNLEEGNFWLLSSVIVENFKAIESATIRIKPGFTIIAGPNGCGKSCFLESIGFGLGASLRELRVSNLSELCGKDRPGHRVRVELRFLRGSNSMIVGSSIADGERQYLVANVKVTKFKFVQTMTETLGFSKDSISWSVSQRAVQEIINSSPKKLFDTVSFIAGTRSVLEARSHANQKISQSELQLISVATLIAKLEGAVVEEKQILQLMTRKEEIYQLLSNCLESKQQCEKNYEAANTFLSLNEASNHVKELLAYSANELFLITKLGQSSHGVDGTNQKVMTDRVQRQSNSPSRTKSRGDLSISARLDECRSELSSANKSMSDIIFKISNLEREVGRLKAEYKDHKNLEESVETKIKFQIATIFEMGEELSLLLKISIRINTLQRGAQSELHRESNYIVQKETQLSTATQVAKHSESLLMAVSASASHQQSIETRLERKLEKEKRYKNSLTEEELLLNKSCNQKTNLGVTKLRFCSIDDIPVMQEKLQSLHRQLLSIRRFLNLPEKHDHDSDSSFAKIDGDHGSLADLLYIITGESLPHKRSSDDAEVSDINLISQNRFNTALDTIISHKLSIKVCKDSVVAQRLMSYSELHGMRIWPLDRLVSSTKRSEGYLEILKKYRNVVIDPISLVQICRRPTTSDECEWTNLQATELGCNLEFADAPMQKVLMRAVENWIIVDNDFNAGRIIQDKKLSRHITGCVTLDGNKHRLGTLTTASKSSYNSQAKSGIELPIDAQIKYRHLTSEYLKLKSKLNSHKREIMESEESDRRSKRLQVLYPLLAVSEENISQLTESLKFQMEQAADAHRELAIARLKLEEVEGHRDMLKGELAKLINSNEDSIRQLFRDQEQDCLDDLISRRNSLEEKSSMLTVSIDEMKADKASLETSVTADNAGGIILGSRIAEIMDQLVTLNQKLLACKSFQVDIQTHFDNCKRELLEEEAEKMHLKSEIDDLRVAFRQKLTELFDNCTKYGQNSLADKCRSHFGSILGVEEQSYVIVSLVESLSKEGKLETLILEELEESKKIMFDFAGQDQLTLLAGDPQQCLQKFRNSVVIARENVLKLNQEALEVDKKLSSKMQIHFQGKVEPEVKSNVRKKRDNDIEKDSDSGSCSSSDDGGKSKRRGIKGQIKTKMSEEHEILQRRESLMREGILRKCSLLNALKQKYEQINLSIAALAEGANGVERAVADLHKETYKALRQRCQRYFSDLVPGKRIDIVPVDPDGHIEEGLKFVLLDDIATADGTGLKGKSDGTGLKGKSDGTGLKGKSDNRYQKSTEELSGGQRALLGLSFLFAAALHKRSPLYLLDEVDAALDETNQKIVGAVIAKIFMKSQVVCVSHHFGYQEQAANYIPIIMKDGHSVITPDYDV